MRSLPPVASLGLTALFLALPLAAAQADPIRYALQADSTLLLHGENAPLTGFLSLEPAGTFCPRGAPPGCESTGFNVTDFQLTSGTVALIRDPAASPDPDLLRGDIRDDTGYPLFGHILVQSTLIGEGLESADVAFKDWQQLVLTVHAEGPGTSSELVYSDSPSHSLQAMHLFLDLEVQTLRYRFDADPGGGLVFLGGYRSTTASVEPFAEIHAVPEPNAQLLVGFGLLALVVTHFGGGGSCSANTTCTSPASARSSRTLR